MWQGSLIKMTHQFPRDLRLSHRKLDMDEFHQEMVYVIRSAGIMSCSVVLLRMLATLFMPLLCC